MAEILYSEEVVQELRGKVVVMTGTAHHPYVHQRIDNHEVQEEPRASAAQL